MELQTFVAEAWGYVYEWCVVSIGIMPDSGQPYIMAKPVRKLEA